MIYALSFSGLCKVKADVFRVGLSTKAPSNIKVNKLWKDVVPSYDLLTTWRNASSEEERRRCMGVYLTQLEKVRKAGTFENFLNWAKDREVALASWYRIDDPREFRGVLVKYLEYHFKDLIPGGHIRTSY